MKKTMKAILFSLMFFAKSTLSLATTFSLPSETEKRYQRIILEEINHYRTHKGLNPLRLNQTVSIKAKQHSLDMASKIMKFSHQGFDERIKYLKPYIIAFAGGAENIACFKLPPKMVVAKWLSSRGHRINIEGNYNITGIGIAQDKNGWIYYTQIFIKDNQI